MSRFLKAAGVTVAGLTVIGAASSALGLNNDHSARIDGGRFRDAYSVCRITAANLGGRPVEQGSPADEACIRAAKQEARTP